MMMNMMSRLGGMSLASVAVVLAVSAGAHAAPTATAAATCDVAKDGRKLGATYVTSLSATKVSCAKAKTLGAGDAAARAADAQLQTAGGSVLALMHDTIAAQRWGLGSVGGEAEIKGGWGPGTRPGAGGGYLDRQMGLLFVKGKPLAVTIAALPADGQHGTGTAQLTRIAKWLVAHVNVRGLPTRPRCG
jgi:hypothetical protein